MGDDRRRCCCGVDEPACVWFIHPQTPAELLKELQYAILEDVTSWVGVYNQGTDQHFDGYITIEVLTATTMRVTAIGYITDEVDPLVSDGAIVVVAGSNTTGPRGQVTTTVQTVDRPVVGTPTQVTLTDDRGETVTFEIELPDTTSYPTANGSDISIGDGLPNQSYPPVEFAYRPQGAGFTYSGTATADPSSGCRPSVSLAIRTQGHFFNFAPTFQGYGSRFNMSLTHDPNGLFGTQFWQFVVSSTDVNNPLTLEAELDFPNTTPLTAALPIINENIIPSSRLLLFEIITGHARLTQNGVVTFDQDCAIYVPICGKLSPRSDAGFNGCPPEVASTLPQSGSSVLNILPAP